MLLLAQVAETFHCRPSELVSDGASHEWGEANREMHATMALQIDIACAVALWRWHELLERQATRE